MSTTDAAITIRKMINIRSAEEMRGVRSEDVLVLVLRNMGAGWGGGWG